MTRIEGLVLSAEDLHRVMGRVIEEIDDLHGRVTTLEKTMAGLLRALQHNSS